MSASNGPLTASLADEGLLADEPLYPHAGTKVLGRALYPLRHTQHHLGELHSELRRRDIARPQWQ